MGLLKGLLRIHIIEAKGLLNKDLSVVAGDVSDPYVTIDVGVTRVAKTNVVDNCLHPRWNEVFHIPVDTKARSVTFKVKDKDLVGSDILGLFAVEVEELLEEETIGGWFTLISPKSRQDSGKIRLEILFTAKKKKQTSVLPTEDLTRNIFPVRLSRNVRLYQDACCNKFPQHETHVRRRSIIQLAPGESAWNDLYNDLMRAQHLIYISGRGLNPDLRLQRYMPCETLGEVLLERAEKGVQVLIVVQIPQKVTWGSPEHYCELHDAERHLKIRFSASRVKVCVQPPPRDEHLTSFVILDTESIDVCDTQRNLVTYFGGLDLVTGRWDTPGHPLFETQRTLHRFDFYNPQLYHSIHSYCQTCGPKDTPDVSIETTTCDSSAPRLPWHDVTCRMEGRVAHDFLLHFEELWLRHGSSVTFVEIDDDDFDLEENNIGCSMDSWNCTVLKALPQALTGTLSRKKKTVSTLEEDIIQRTLCENIRQAKKFIYIECPTLFYLSKLEPELNPIVREIVTRIIVSITHDSLFSVVIVMPQQYFQTSKHNTCRESHEKDVKHHERQCITKMYEMLATTIAQYPHSKHRHPTDYLNLFSLRNSGSSTPFKIKEQHDHIESEMIFVHSQVTIIDDEVMIIGSPNTLDQNMMKESEVAVLYKQPNYTSEIGGPSPRGDIYRFRMSLWLEHAGDTETAWTDPSSRHCVETLQAIARDNATKQREGKMCNSHLTLYPIDVEQSGKVTFLEDLQLRQKK